MSSNRRVNSKIIVLVFSSILALLTSLIVVHGVTIGGRENGFFNGTIDEVRIYNWSLVADEVKEHYYSVLYKYDSDRWQLYVNQSNLTDGTYTYFGAAQDNFGNENRTETRTLIVSTDNVPVVDVTNITPYTAYTNDSLQCEFNITDRDSSDTLTVNVTWFRDNNNGSGFMRYNTSDEFSLNVTNGMINTTRIGIPANLTYHNERWICQVVATDGTNVANHTNSSIRTISNYTTNISIQNDSGKNVDEEVMFYANYSNLDYGHIGRLLWQSIDTDDALYSVGLFDYENDGNLDDIIVGGRGFVYSFDSLGDNVWNLSVGTINDWIHDIEVFDDGNGYLNTIAVSLEAGEGNGSLMLINRTGGKICNTSDLGNAYSLAVGDIDRDNISREIVVGGDTGTVAAVWVFNMSCELIWQNITSDSSYEVYEVETGDFDNDGYRDEVGIVEYSSSDGYIRLFNGSGDEQWNVGYPGSGSSLEVANLDGIAGDDLIVGINNQTNAYNGSGINLWNNTQPIDNIYEIRFGDFDNDALRDDIAVLDNGNWLFLFNDSGVQIWNASLPPDSSWYSLIVEDLDDDNYDDIAVGGDNKIIYFNYSGINHWNYSLGSDTSSRYADGGIEVGDVNGDGVYDIAAANQDNYVYVLQEVKCRIQFNDSASKYDMTWNNTIAKWQYNRTFLIASDYGYNITCEKAGYETQNASSVVTISPDNAPQWSNNLTNASASTAYNWTVYFNATLSDDLGGDWYVLNYGNSSDLYVNTTPTQWTTPENVSVVLKINFTRGQQFRWRFIFNDSGGNWNNTDTWDITINNTLPKAPEQIEPTQNNDTVFERRPLFNWSAAFDPDNDNLTYDIFITCATCADINVSGINNTYYTPSVDLDLDVMYNWSVRANDSTGYGPWSSEWNFTVVSVAIITVNGTADFGSLWLNQEDDTTDNDPSPFIIENKGNVNVNVSVYAQDDLWLKQPLNTTYFQFKADNVSGGNSSFSWSESITEWENVNGTTSGSAIAAIMVFNYTTGYDQVEVDVRVRVPSDEPSGTKTSTLVFEAKAS
jgi:hypothetical protein